MFNSSHVALFVDRVFWSSFRSNQRKYNAFYYFLLQCTGKGNDITDEINGIVWNLDSAFYPSRRRKIKQTPSRLSLLSANIRFFKSDLIYMRYSPSVAFFSEGLSKLSILCFITYVAAYLYLSLIHI